MLKKSVISVAIVAIFSVSNVYAWGLTDLVGVGMQAGGKLVGASVEKATEAKPDPEAEAARKREDERVATEHYQKLSEEIEAKPGLRPIEREKLILSLQGGKVLTEKIKYATDCAEEKRKEERDKLFTPSGAVGAVGNASLNQVVANVNVSNAVTRSVSNGVAIVQVDKGIKVGASGMADVMSHSEQVSSRDASHVMSVKDAFSPDLGKSVFIEFVGSPSATTQFKKLLAARGHHLVDSKDQADVVYLAEGEFTVPDTKLYSGISNDAGELLENPSLTLPTPEKKLTGGLKLGLTKFMVAMAQVDTQALPDTVLPHEGMYLQKVLMVIARQPKGEKETRFSVSKSAETETLEGAKMVSLTTTELFDRLGLSDTDTGKKQ